MHLQCVFLVMKEVSCCAAVRLTDMLIVSKLWSSEEEGEIRLCHTLLLVGDSVGLGPHRGFVDKTR